MLLAWLGAALIGLSLGLLGSGGSILTVPVLVYLVGEHSKLAITESLAIVGCISLCGALPYALGGQVLWRSVWLFGLPGMLGTYLGSALSQLLSGRTQLSLFAAVMLLSATFMFRTPAAHAQAAPQPAYQTALQGLGVGLLTGLVGVGGGFLIVPALVLLGGLPMQSAVATSLMIIVMNSFTGFIKHLNQLPSTETLHWPLMALFAVIGMGGSLLGSQLSKKVPSHSLRRAFAGFLVLMGAGVLLSNLGAASH